jgi:hypothetical protein
MTEGAAAVLLEVAGLTVPADELLELSGQYPTIRASLDLLYAPVFAEVDPYLVPTLIPEETP